MKHMKQDEDAPETAVDATLEETRNIWEVPCPGAAKPRLRWWHQLGLKPHTVGHELMVRWRHQVTHLSSSGMLLALDSGKRQPECVIFCTRCDFSAPNGQAPVAEAMYALQDAGQPLMANAVGIAQRQL